MTVKSRYGYIYIQTPWDTIRPICRRRNTAICNDMHGSWEYPTKRHKLNEKKSQETYDFTHMWSIKGKATSEPTRKTHTTPDTDNSMVVASVKGGTERGQKVAGVPSLLASLGHTGRRRVVSGHPLNTLRHIITETSHDVLTKWMVLCGATVTAVLGCRRPQTTDWTPPDKGPGKWRREESCKMRWLPFHWCLSRRRITIQNRW